MKRKRHRLESIIRKLGAAEHSSASGRAGGAAQGLPLQTN